MRCPMDGSFHLSLIGSACGGGSDWSSQLGNADLNASGVSVGSDGYSDLGSSIFSTLPDGALYFCPQSESVATCHVSPSLAQSRLDIRQATSPVSIISRIRFVSFAAQRDSLMARRYLPDYGGLSASIVSLDSVNPAREEFDRLMENRRMRSGLKVRFCVVFFVLHARCRGPCSQSLCLHAEAATVAGDGPEMLCSLQDLSRKVQGIKTEHRSLRAEFQSLNQVGRCRPGLSYSP